MRIDTDKIDDTVLALLHLTSFTDRGASGAWKGHDWDALNRLHEKGMISNPRTKTKSVALTDEGAKRAKELFEKYFTKPE
jgi:DNA-binding PadR family transcriptional regulator